MIFHNRMTIHQSAYKHGYKESDILSALSNMIDNFALANEIDKEMAIGWTASGELIEIIYLLLDDDGIMVIHAMKCRKQYLRGQ